jgi:hypothetical protein
VEGFCGILFGGVFILFVGLPTLPFWFHFVLTLFVSILGCALLAIGLMVYDKWNSNTDQF